jgi:hypothetical protein
VRELRLGREVRGYRAIVPRAGSEDERRGLRVRSVVVSQRDHAGGDRLADRDPGVLLAPVRAAESSATVSSILVVMTVTTPVGAVWISVTSAAGEISTAIPKRVLDRTAMQHTSRTSASRMRRRGKTPRRSAQERAR